MKRRTFRQIVRDGLRLLWSDVKEIKWVIMGIIAYFVVLRTFFSRWMSMGSDYGNAVSGMWTYQSRNMSFAF